MLIPAVRLLQYPGSLGADAPRRAPHDGGRRLSLHRRHQRVRLRAVGGNPARDPTADEGAGISGARRVLLYEHLFGNDRESDLQGLLRERKVGRSLVCAQRAAAPRGDHREQRHGFRPDAFLGNHGLRFSRIAALF